VIAADRANAKPELIKGSPPFPLSSPLAHPFPPPRREGDGIEETVGAAAFARADQIRARRRARREERPRVDSPHVPARYRTIRVIESAVIARRYRGTHPASTACVQRNSIALHESHYINRVPLRALLSNASRLIFVDCRAKNAEAFPIPPATPQPLPPLPTFSFFWGRVTLPRVDRVIAPANFGLSFVQRV